MYKTPTRVGAAIVTQSSRARVQLQTLLLLLLVPPALAAASEHESHCNGDATHNKAAANPAAANNKQPFLSAAALLTVRDLLAVPNAIGRTASQRRPGKTALLET